MASKRASAPNKHRRRPRKGFLFIFVRSAGLLLKVVGLLLLGIAVIGSIFMLIKVGPLFVESIRGLLRQTAGFLFIATLLYLLFFPIVGFVGVVIAGIGFVLSYAGTEPAASTSIITPDPVQNSQLEPPTKSTG